MRKIVYALLVVFLFSATLVPTIKAQVITIPLTVIVHPDAVVTDYAINRAINQAEVFLNVDYLVTIDRPLSYKTSYSNVRTVKRLKNNMVLILPESKMNRGRNGVAYGNKAIVTDNTLRFNNVMIHELGHMNGLGHTSTGIMASRID